MRWLSLVLALLLPALPGPARAETEDAALVRLLTLEEARPWVAVGRVNVAGQGFCTGTLIAPDLVLTAAHCLFLRTGVPVRAEQVHFLAGYRKGTYAAHRRVRRYVVHADYDLRDTDRTRQLRADIAVLELDQPVGPNAALPFERAPRPSKGDPVTLVSYARERSEVPSIQAPCHVIDRQRRVLLLSCDVNYGASGAPVFVMQDARPKVAALISAMAEVEGRQVAVSIELSPGLDEVLQALALSDPTFRAVRPEEAATLGQRLGRTEGPGLRKVSRPPPAAPSSPAP